MFSQFLLVLVSLAVVFAVPHQIVIDVNSKPYTIQFETTNYSVLGLSHKFCSEMKNEFGLKTREDIVFSCMSPVAPSIRREIEKSIDPSQVVAGEFDAETKAWIQSVQSPGPTQTQPSASRLPTNHEVRINAGNTPFTIVVDLNNFTLISVAESFCLLRANELGLTTLAQLLDSCIAPVANIVKDDLSKSYVPTSIPVGELSNEVQKLIQAQSQPPKAAAAEPKKISISIVANDAPYTIVTDLNSFSLLTTAEEFCRQKASVFGIENMEQLVIRCIPPIASMIKKQLIDSQYDAATIPQGDLSKESAAWYDEYLRQSSAQQAAHMQTMFEITIPIDGKEYVAKFDLQKSTPMSVAEAMCTSPDLGLTSDAVVVESCMPSVAKFVKEQVDSRIAPRTVAIGNYSPTVQNVVNQIIASRKQQQQP